MKFSIKSSCSRIKIVAEITAQTDSAFLLMKIHVSESIKNWVRKLPMSYKGSKKRPDYTSGVRNYWRVMIDMVR